MPRRSIALILGLLTSTLVVGTLVAGTAPAGAASTGPMNPETSCPAVPYDNVWNTRINKLRVHSMSETWLASMSSSNTQLHPDYGPAGAGQQPYGIPWE